MSKVLISLVGHQPLPTLMLTRYLRPSKVILISTNDETIQKRKNNLSALISSEQISPGNQIQVAEPAPVDAWNIRNVLEWLELEILPNEIDPGDQLIYDVTGGTKAMSIGLARTASKYDGKLVYVDSSNVTTNVWCYTIIRNDVGSDIGLESAEQPKTIPRCLTIDDLFVAYLGPDVSVRVKPKSAAKDAGDFFEHDVLAGFLPLVDDHRCSVQIHGNQEEIDIVLQKGNKFALVECKSGRLRNMHGIKQLNNLASDRYLGTYTGKILAAKTVEDETLATVAEQHNIHVLRLPEWAGQGWALENHKKFQLAIDSIFGLERSSL